MILTQGPSLFTALAAVLFFSPLQFLHGLACALSMFRRSSKGLIRHLAYFAEAAWLLRRMKSLGVEHLHAHFGTNPAALARISRRMGGASYSFTVHGPDEFDNPVGLDLKGKISDADRCIAISSYGRSQLMRWASYADWPKIKVVRCGVDDHFLGDHETTPVPDTPTLCCVARLSAQKGLPLLIEAAGNLKRRGTEFRLTIVGDGEMRASLEDLTATLGLDEHVEFVGWASSQDVREHLLAARAMVLPSFAEGLPVVLMEALALERPAISTAIAGIPELVDNGCGRLVPAGNVAALAKTMQDILTTPVLELRELGKEGRRRVLSRHDALLNAKSLLSEFQAVHGSVE